MPFLRRAKKVPNPPLSERLSLEDNDSQPLSKKRTAISSNEQRTSNNPAPATCDSEDDKLIFKRRKLNATTARKSLKRGESSDDALVPSVAPLSGQVIRTTPPLKPSPESSPSTNHKLDEFVGSHQREQYDLEEGECTPEPEERVIKGRASTAREDVTSTATKSDRSSQSKSGSPTVKKELHATSAATQSGKPSQPTSSHSSTSVADSPIVNEEPYRIPKKHGYARKDEQLDSKKRSVPPVVPFHPLAPSVAAEPRSLTTRKIPTQLHTSPFPGSICTPSPDSGARKSPSDIEKEERAANVKALAAKKLSLAKERERLAKHRNGY